MKWVCKVDGMEKKLFLAFPHVRLLWMNWMEMISTKWACTRYVICLWHKDGNNIKRSIYLFLLSHVYMRLTVIKNFNKKKHLISKRKKEKISFPFNKEILFQHNHFCLLLLISFLSDFILIAYFILFQAKIFVDFNLPWL